MNLPMKGPIIDNSRVPSTVTDRLAILDAFVCRYASEGATYEDLELVQIMPDMLMIEWRSAKRAFRVNKRDTNKLIYTFQEI